ncbi:hypothetical protein BDU57DRAFT_41802 [Ampelomyces quisqualis]|uniref:DUF676 domain-containing protein n=1 Tax=Ampelomyces quisqualis TaxID=50730 RepID=A0A6A5QZH6_AMPQU|nr:hypothetical protein BDU57DRAFT_41802 [Ampelomyces quisqualis]
MNPQVNNSCVDIVAVHGLGAIPDITFKERDSGVNWLSDNGMLPSATPRARIMRFGYDSLWMGKTPIRTSLSTIAYKLLLSLNMDRTEDPQRPLIFIGHCFGGLVIQRALNLAKMRPGEYPGVFDSCTGIVFLGTPHRGTRSFTRESALFAAIAASSDLSQKIEVGVLDALRSEEGALLETTDDFVGICNDSRSMITCFFEQRPSKLGKVVGRDDVEEFIVDQTSATIDGHHKYGLELDHFSLNKFDRPDNPNYIQVRAEIVRFYQAALTRVGRSTALQRHEMPSVTFAYPENLGILGNRRASTPVGPQSSSHITRLPERSDSSSGDRAAPSSRPAPDVPGEQEEIKKGAIHELRDEEAKKQKLLFEEDIKWQRLDEKRVAEQQYVQRLKRNMAKYGVNNPDEILTAYKLPDDRELKSQQEINDKNEWFRNQIRGELIVAGLDGGQIDEILNDTGETMIIDGVETTYTRMARKWISPRTLDRYDIPWQYDKDDPSVLIIKRWVPDYERNFLWDHSQAIRPSRGRKMSRDGPRDLKDMQNKRTTSDWQNPNAWVVQMFQAFSGGLNPEARRENLQDGFKGLAQRISESMARRKEEQASRERDGSFSTQRHVYGESSHQFDRIVNSNTAYLAPAGYTRPDYISQRSAPNVPTTTSTRRRRSSIDSIHSAPDVQEVTLRRQRSRSLSRSGERVPIAQTSGDFSRQPTYHERDVRRLRNSSGQRENSKARKLARLYPYIRAASEVYLAQRFRGNDRTGRNVGGLGRKHSDAESLYADTESQYAETEWQYDEAENQYHEAERHFLTADRQYADANIHYTDTGRHYSDTERQYTIENTQSLDTARRYSDTERYYSGTDKRHSDIGGNYSRADRYDGTPSPASHNMERPTYMITAPRYDPYPKSPQNERRFVRPTDI